MKADSGKSIPLVPGTTTPHKCPEKQEAPPEQAHVTMEGKSEPPTDKGKYEGRPNPVTPPHREFGDENIKVEAKLINEWARKTAHEYNWKTLDQSETMEDRRARNIAENVDKKDLMHYYFYVKYGQKKNPVDNVP